MIGSWKRVKIGDYCKVLSSKRVFASDYVDKGIPFYRSKEIIQKAFGEFSGDEIYISEKKFNEFKSKFGAPVKGDILLSSVGNRSGIAYLIKEEYDFYFKDGNLIWMKDFSNELYSKFLEFYLRSEIGQQTIESMMIGAAQKALTIDGVKKIKINLPPLKTQRKIASILSAYDDLIENNLKRIKLLEEQAQLTYEEWFVRFKFPGHETTKFDEETGLPEGWEKVRLKDLGVVVTGKTPSTSKKENYDGDIPFIKTPDMSGFPYVMKTSQYLTQKGAETQKKKYLPKNSLVVSCIGSAGQYALVSENSQFNQQINAIKFSKEFFTFYTYCFSKYLKPLLEALGSNGATMTNVNKGKFENIDVLKPSEKILELFHNRVKSNFDVIYALMKQNQLLKEARDILLPRLMSGMIDVEKLDVGSLNYEVNDSLGMVAEENKIYSKE